VKHYSRNSGQNVLSVIEPGLELRQTTLAKISRGKGLTRSRQSCEIS